MDNRIVKVFLDCGIDIALSPRAGLSSRKSKETEQVTKGIETLELLKEEVLKVDCDLKQYATNLVFGEGPDHADIMVIGEAPGAEEDLQGRPFVGQSGQLLIKALKSIGLERESVYITNTVPWRPVMNRNPTPSEIALFMPFKRQQIKLIKPKIILCLGSIAAKTITGDNSGIMKMRGRWLDYEDGILVLATFHPAYLLRSPTQKKLFWQDLVKLKIKYQEITGR